MKTLFNKYFSRHALAMACQLLLAIVLTVVSTATQAERIKDVAGIAGVRNNQLIGYGLVVGLDGSGDQTTQTQFTVQSLRNMLAQLGVTIPANVNPQLQNVAAVMVHADLPPFAKPGQTIDITVSSIGNSDSLRGGSLLMTPMKGIDGNIYAIAQGNLIVGGISAEGGDGSSTVVNIPSAGRIPNGATVEREVASSFAHGNTVTLNLHSPDFTTAQNMAASINNFLGEGSAAPIDSASVRVQAPIDPGQKVSFIAELEKLNIETGAAPAKIIVNSRTGTVVIGSHVRVKTAAVSHGSLSVTIQENDRVSQPGPFSGGQTALEQSSLVSIEQEASRMFVFEAGVTLDELVRAVNMVGAPPLDLVAILEALQQVGALKAQLVVI